MKCISHFYILFTFVYDFIRIIVYLCEFNLTQHNQCFSDRERLHETLVDTGYYFYSYYSQLYLSSHDKPANAKKQYLNLVPFTLK